MRKRKILILSITIVAVALILETCILQYVNDKNAQTTSNVLLDRVIAVIDKNESIESEFVKSLKDDYIVRAKAISYIADAKPEVEYDVDELQKIAGLMSVDEIHFIDDTGTIYSGSLPKYFGYSFDSGEQMAFFKQMLNNKDLTLCQDVTPNTAEAKEMMYAITWNEAKTHMVQVGITPKRLLKELKRNQISNVVADMPVYKGMEIYVVDAKTKKILGATDASWVGNTAHFNHKGYRFVKRKHGDYIVAVCMLESMNAQTNIVAILIVGIYLTLASCLLVLMLSRVLKEKYEKEKYIYTSNTDELTKCFNRRAYDLDMENLDLNTEWVYISLDLNGLKKANDTLGHSAGDELICAASNCMKFAFASYGKIYRIGGDEFVVLIQESVSNIDSILQVFDTTIHDWHGKYSNSISVSYGVVKSSEQDFDSIHSVSKLADERMYKSKSEYYNISGNDRRR
ncbi:GGDEF domain-containing protein [Holdemanella biformis]|uniref:GGDEF domain-containing protein n=1 Tax=Holdemanella biformis TaxID=1735 RepID=UPI00242CA7F4|nr:GGDEF domain-containing protein [Holdemanella biformis]MBS6454232.1 GGDEF domain-containing protein [Holdemanella biformis]